MLDISLCEDTEANNIKLENAVVRNLSKFCEIHTTEKTTFLCITCKTYICDKCEEGYHKGHHILAKTEIHNYEKKLLDKRDDLNNKLKSIGIDCNFQDFYKKFRSDFNKRGEDIIELVENIKKREIIILNKFKSHLDKHFPKVMDFRDNLENLITQIAESNRENLLKNETEFADFYEKYLQFNEIIPKTEENINILTNKIEKYNTMFETFKQKTEDILNYMNNNLIQINDIQTTDEQILEKVSISPRKANRKNSVRKNSLKDDRSSNLNNNLNNIAKKINFDIDANAISDSPGAIQSALPKELTTKMSILNSINKAKQISNLRNLKKESNLKSSNDISDISGFNFKDKDININPGSSQKVVNEDKVEEEEKNKDIKQVDNVSNNIVVSDNNKSQVVENTIINIIVATNNILVYDQATKVFAKKEIDLNNLGFKKFEAYHSTLNFNNKFYIAGGYGYATSKSFCLFNSETNNFSKLQDMPSGHSYNGLVGLNDDIYVVSGFKSNKVEKYSIANNNWTKLPDLNFSRSWPNCFNSFSKNSVCLYVVGGYIEGQNENSLESKIEVIEYLDIRQNKKWDKLEVNLGELINMPFNSGLIKLNELEVLLLGGRIEKDKDSESRSWILTLNNDQSSKANLSIKEEVKLTEAEEFDGKNFVYLGEDLYGQYSSIYFNKFYLFNAKENTITVDQFNEEK